MKKSEYWIIDMEGEGTSEGTNEARGPFPTIRAAKQWIISDAKETFLDADKSLRDLSESIGWAAPLKIVEVLETIVVEPSCEVSVNLKEQEGE